MNERLNIGDNLDLCTFNELKSVVYEFIAIKNPSEDLIQTNYENN